MNIHELNTKAITSPAYVALDDGEDTYKLNLATRFNNTDTAISEMMDDISDLEDRAQISYGETATSAGTSTKVVTVSDPNFGRDGDYLVIKFTNGNTASTMGVNISGFGTSQVKFNGESSAPQIDAGAMLLFHMTDISGTAPAPYYRLDFVGYYPKSKFTEIDEDITDLKSDIDEDETLLNKVVTVGKNKWNPNAVSANTNISNNPSYLYGETIEQNGYYTSDYFAVNGGDTVSWYYNNNASAAQVARSTMYRVAEYDENKTVVRVSANWAASPFTTASNTRFVRVVLNQNQPLNMIVLNETTTPIFFEQYQTTTEFKRISDIEDNITEIEDNITGIENPAVVILPSAIYGVAGQEINIYKENLVLNNRLKSYAYIHTRFSANAWQDDLRTIWTPSGTILAESNQIWEIMKYGLLEVQTKTIKECVVPKDTGTSNKKVLIIGDSKVDNGFVSYHFLHNFDDDNMSVTLLGSKYDWSTSNRNEGWGGKTAKWFCTDAESPLSNNGACDFAHYLSAYSIETPDFVFINLGTNDCASASGGNDGFINDFVTHITEMITSIHSVSSSIVVIVGMCEGVSTVQDTNNAEFDKWDLNQKISRLHMATITEFDNRSSENIYICPMYMGMDLTQDYPMTEVPLSKRDGDVNNGSGDGKTRMQITDRVHQNEVGYWKNADYMYALFKYIVAKSA